MVAMILHEFASLCDDRVLGLGEYALGQPVTRAGAAIRFFVVANLPKCRS